MIRVRNLTKVYGETTAVDQISFDVEPGEILGFLGPNGAGKSTTMRVLTGYTPPTGGEASIGGFDVLKQSREVRRVIGYLPENAPVYDEMTVRGFVDFFAETKGWKGTERSAAVERALEECGVADIAERLLGNLSKGYRQRAALAQAVVGDPKVLILDEPTVGLDPRQVREIRSLIRNMAGRRTVILSTHILPEVSLICSQVVIIDRGRIVASGTPENIESNQEDSNQLILTVRGPRESVEQVIQRVEHVRSVESNGYGRPEPGEEAESDEETQIREYRVTVEDDYDIRSRLARDVVQCGFELLELRSAGLSLEDVFINTITRGEEMPPAEEEREPAAS